MHFFLSGIYFGSEGCKAGGLDLPLEQKQPGNVKYPHLRPPSGALVSPGAAHRRARPDYCAPAGPRSSPAPLERALSTNGARCRTQHWWPLSGNFPAAAELCRHAPSIYPPRAVTVARAGAPPCVILQVEGSVCLRCCFAISRLRTHADSSTVDTAGLADVSVVSRWRAASTVRLQCHAPCLLVPPGQSTRVSKHESASSPLSIGRGNPPRHSSVWQPCRRNFISNSRDD